MQILRYTTYALFIAALAKCLILQADLASVGIIAILAGLVALFEIITHNQEIKSLKLKTEAFDEKHSELQEKIQTLANEMTGFKAAQGMKTIHMGKAR